MILVTKHLTDPSSRCTEFSLAGRNPTWTTRFTIAAANGDVTPPEFSTQPGASGTVAIPYGIGRLSSGAVVPVASTSRVVGTGNATSAISLGPLTSLAPLPTSSSPLSRMTTTSSAIIASASSVAVVTATQPSVVPAATVSTAAVVRPTSSGEIARAGALLSLVFGVALLA